MYKYSIKYIYLLYIYLCVCVYLCAHVFVEARSQCQMSFSITSSVCGKKKKDLTKPGTHLFGWPRNLCSLSACHSSLGYRWLLPVCLWMLWIQTWGLMWLQQFFIHWVISWDPIRNTFKSETHFVPQDYCYSWITIILSLTMHCP